MKVSKYRIALGSVLKCEIAAAKSPLARVRTEVFHFLLSQPSQSTRKTLPKKRKNYPNSYPPTLPLFRPIFETPTQNR